MFYSADENVFSLNITNLDYYVCSDDDVRYFVGEFEQTVVILKDSLCILFYKIRSFLDAVRLKYIFYKMLAVVVIRRI